MLTVISYVSLFLPTSNKPFLVLGVIRRDYDWLLQVLQVSNHMLFPQVKEVSDKIMVELGLSLNVLSLKPA